MKRGFRPRVEGCEPRELLSGIIAAMAARPRIVHTLQNPNVSPTSQFFQPNSNSPYYFLSPLGQPTALTLKRTQFHAFFVGPYNLYPGRTSQETSQIYIRGAGSSNNFLHGDIQIHTVVQPNAANNPPPPNGGSLINDPVVGSSTMYDRNNNNNGQLGFALYSPTTAAIDKYGRPSTLNWLIDVNTSAGVYGEASGQGTLSIHYGPLKHLKGMKGPGIGLAYVKITGNILPTSVGSPLANAYINP